AHEPIRAHGAAGRLHAQPLADGRAAQTPGHPPDRRQLDRTAALGRPGLDRGLWAPAADRPLQSARALLPPAPPEAGLGPAAGALSGGEAATLKELQVRDLALVESARVRFGPGLNLLTGETGSGKSLIVDALGLALGARASTDQVRHGSQRAFVEATFEDAVLAREIGKRGAARVDGRPATPAQLRELGQHEHHTLLDPEAQTGLLDAFAGALAVRESVAERYGAWNEAAAHLAGLERMRDRGSREREYLAWQLEELRGAGLRPGEDEELAAERSVARHAARLAELAGRALEALRGDESIAVAAGDVRAAAELDPRLGALADRLSALEDETADVTAEVRHYTEQLDSDPGRLERIEERLSVLESIKRKHGGSLEAAIALRDRLATQLVEGEDLGAAIEAAQARTTAARTGLE